MPTIIVNINTKAPYDVYIGRPSKWGNPFRLADYGNDRQLVLRKFEQLLRRKEHVDLIGEAVQELYGKRLGCYCRPESCHGDVLIKLMEEWRVDHGKTLWKAANPKSQS